MIARLKRICAQAGVAEDAVEDLVRLVIKPPEGTINVTDLAGANDVQVALQAATVAATNTRQFGQALQALLAFVDVRQVALSDYDSGRFWHLKGVAVQRLGKWPEALYPTTRTLNRSVAMLERSDTPDTQTYLARVFDTCGQVLQHQGLLLEARLEFERALCLREAAADPVGEAWTLGSLGRLCMELELGDFAATAGYLARDLAIVEELSPERTRVRAQLLSHLGTCAVEQGDAEQGRGYFTRSVALARADNDAFGLAFAAIGLGRVALLGADLAQAEKHAEEALAHLASSAFSQDDQEGVRGLIHQLKAEVHLARNATPQAVEAFAAAYTCFLQTSRDSVVEMARLLYGYARACLANGEEQQAAHLLREALQYLDASTAEPLRQEIEGMLRTNFQEAWLLHAISRLIGQQYMDFLLVHAGGTEFRGARQDVVILFSDLRGFTILTEQSAAEPDAFVTILNDYLRHMTRCIDHAGGIVCQFNGDGILAVFSLPIPRPADAAARRAVLAALLMQEELLYTVNGDAANTAARLEGLTKYLGASILLSEEVTRRLPTPNRLLLPEPPEGKRRPLVSRDCLRFAFTGYGMQVDALPQPADCLYLEVGNRLAPGIIDQHHLAAYTGSTARLVLHHPDPIDGAVSPQRALTDPFTMVLHREPDLDCLASAYLAMAYLEQRAFPPHAEVLVAYVDLVDQGYLGMSQAYPFALYSADNSVRHRLLRRPWDTPEAMWSQGLQEGFAILAFVLGEMQGTAHDIIQIDAFACPDVLTSDDRQEIHRDLARYRRKLHDPACQARVLTLALPGQQGGYVTADTLLIRDVQNANDPERCIFFKDWARTDQVTSPHQQGFVALCVFESATPPVLPRCIISVRPDSEASLQGLGQMLDQQEATARIQRFGVVDRVVDPQTQTPKPLRLGYDNSDPWYDGRGHNYTIVDAPRHGTVLSADAIERVLLAFAKGHGETQL